MSVDLRVFGLDAVRGSQEFRMVESIAQQLLLNLNSASSLSLIAAANTPKASSHAIQNTFTEFIRSLGFVEESRGLFAEYESSALRPDYFLPLGDTGILLEVERGKTTINNMDLLDFWKCHLCSRANYLFLMVPKALRQNDRMRPRNEFVTVARRLGAFFLPQNRTNVRGLAVPPEN